MRDLSAVPELHTATDLLAFLREDPQDRFVHYGSDLTEDDFHNGVATRGGTCISVHSLRAMGISSINEFLPARRAAGAAAYLPSGQAISELASIGSPTVRDRFGRVFPPEIRQLLNEAGDKAANRRLSCGPFEDYYVLPEHADAEQGIGFGEEQGVV